MFLQTNDEVSKRSGRRPRHASVALVIRGKDAIAVKSDIVSREIINALRDKKSYSLCPEQNVAEHKHQFYQKNKGQIMLSIRPLEDEGWETVLSSLNTLGDGCIDTYLAVMAMAIDCHGTQHISLPLQVSPDDILEVCGKKKSHGSFTALQRVEIIKHLKTLAQVHVVATIPGYSAHRRGRKGEDLPMLSAEGAVIDLLNFKIDGYSTITGEEIWEECSVAVGEWVSMIPELSTKTATMSRQVLAYSAKNERYQKRLGIYLTFMFRINARYGGKFPNDISMGALLEGAGIVAPRQQGEFREAIENALERLKHDNVIGDYWRVVDGSPRAQQIERDIREHGRGWFDSYLEQKWNFVPPANVKEQYRKLRKEVLEERVEDS